jgi:type VI secretion system protein ImpA
MIPVQDLLKPISDSKPCGEDLSYPGLEELETILKGKPEVEIGNVKKPAEPPDWRELSEKSAGFLRQSKHLRAAVILCGALLKTENATGFRDGLTLVRGLLENFWAPVYPLLDPEDNNDPTQRLNILGSLTAPRGSVGGWLRIVDYLHEAPLCKPKGAGPITFDDISAAKLREQGGEGVPPNAPDPAKLARAIQDGGRDQITATYDALKESLATVQAIDQLLTSTLGAGSTISFEVLQKSLQDMIAGVGSYLGNGASTTAGASTQAASDDASAQEDGGAGPAGIQIKGPIRSADDVVSTIERICSYYVQVEPSSPVLFILRRAQKLAKMNFVQAVQELNLATIDALKPSMGSAVDESAASGAATETPRE